MVYAAHKAAGGITSLYRQIGIGCEQLFRQIIRDQFLLDAAQATWSYTIKTPGGKDRKLSLDGRIQLEDLQTDEHKQRVRDWMVSVGAAMNMDKSIADALKGPVFEIRQGYKSKDSKRQNADIGNAGTAYAQGYLPVVAVLSTQIDNDVADRYIGAGWLVLRGYVGNSPITSTYAFCKQVLGYDLADFLTRHSDVLKHTVEEVLEALLTPSDKIVEVAHTASELEAVDELEAIGELEDEEGDDEYES